MRLALFIGGWLVLDQSLGAGLDVLLQRTETGEAAGAINVALSHQNADVLIFGSSRAKQHLDPDVIVGARGGTAYNAAANGQGLPYAAGLLALIEARGGHPRCIVLHVDVVDLVDPKVDRAAVLLPWSREAPDILALQARVDRWAPFKAWSSTWRYNGVALAVLRNQVGHADPKATGFTPRSTRRAGFADDREFLGASKPDEAFVASPVAVDLLKDITQRAERLQADLLIVTSPMNRPDSVENDALADPKRAAAAGWLASRTDAYRSFDEARVPAFRDSRLFVDGAHLSADGAALLSNLLATALVTDCPTQ